MGGYQSFLYWVFLFKVFRYLNNMDSYTEPSNVNSLEDVDCTDADETLWKLLNAKILFKNGT